MSFRSVATAFLLVAAFVGCKPTARGQCTNAADCRTGSYCSTDLRICLAASGTCSPACGSGQICSGSKCSDILPTVSVTAPSGPISPAFPQLAVISPAFPHVTVHVDASAAVPLHGISLQADMSTPMVASGTLDTPQPGDNLVTLSQFDANAVGTVSLRATLTFQVPGFAQQTVSSAAVQAFLDAQPPTVTVFVPPASDAVNGWVPRTAGTLEVRATVDDGVGSGAQSATLSFDACPAAAPCTYAGTQLSQAAGATTYSFLVPRAAQAIGSEAPLAVTVKALDVAGNQGVGTGALQIDDAPPQVGALSLVTVGVAGEDGKTWFIGGSTAPNVEIAIPVTDSGAGVASLGLRLDKSDLVNGFPNSQLTVPGSPAADGWHFQLPASGVRSTEGHVRFTLTATDKLQHTSTLGPDDPRTMIWVDAVPPVIVGAPHVVYTSATGANPQCAAETPTYNCGRQFSSAGAPTRLLADDSATVTFDAYDCGSGMAAPLAAMVKTAAGGSNPATVSTTGQAAGNCSNGSTNPLHHYAFTLNLPAQAPVLDPPDTTGTTVVQLFANMEDRVLLPSSSPASTSGDGSAQVSLWRWRSQVTTNAQPSGSPALIPAAAGVTRQIAIGTTLPATGPNFFVLNADGTPAWNATVPNGMAGDVAAGSGGLLYVVSPPAGSCSSDCTAALNIIAPPAAASSPGTVQACAASHVSFGAPPAIAANPERAVVAATNLAPAATANVFVFQSTCSSPEPYLVPNTGPPTSYPGISASWPTVFLPLANGPGFISIDHNVTGSGFVTGQPRSYNTSSSSVPTQAPPSVSLSPLHAIFSSTAPDEAVHVTQQATCGTFPLTSSCWTDASGYTATTASSNLPFTPVFDSAALYVADDRAKVYAFDKLHGTASWSYDFRSTPLPSGWPSTGGVTLSPPVLLQSGSVLVVLSDGVVALASSAGAHPLLKVTALSGSPAAPVIEARGSGGVAYVHDGQGWIYALQIPAPVAVPGSAVWPRPGRDSCNSRNAASLCP